MSNTIRCIVLTCLLSSGFLGQSDEKQPSHRSYPYDVVRSHEIKPHRRTVPMKGVRQGFNQLSLTLNVSAAGNVVDVEAGGDDATMKYWPLLENEVGEWQFIPFEDNGRAGAAEI